jgi:hypothetical protein
VKADINPADVPPGTLINFLQKGLQYLEVETHVKDVNFSEWKNSQLSDIFNVSLKCLGWNRS